MGQIGTPLIVVGFSTLLLTACGGGDTPSRLDIGPGSERPQTAPGRPSDTRAPSPTAPANPPVRPPG